MSTVTKLSGWNVEVKKRKFAVTTANGLPSEIEGFAFVYTEVDPNTGNKVIFECTKEIADLVVGSITGIVIPGMDTPIL
jgi:hypothetical protein